MTKNFILLRKKKYKMVKKFSISVLISGNLKKKIIKITKNINLRSKDKYVSIPHINILSGSYTDKTKLLKIFNKIKFNKKKIIKSIGVGVFAGKKNVIYLRFELNNFIVKLRNHVCKILKLTDKQIDLTAKDILWTPKCTLAILRGNNKKFLSILNYTKRNFSKQNFNTKNLILMDVTSSETILKKK